MKKFYSFILVCLLPVFSYGQSLDLELYDELYGHRNQSLDGTANFFSASVYPVAIATPLIQALYGLGTRDFRHTEYALQTTAGLIINTAVTYGMKHAFNRKRPYDEHPQYTPYEHDSSPSFPSGHSSYAFTTATSLSLQYKRWYVVTPAYLWASAVAYSRIHKGAHYPSDIVVGAIVGAGSAYLSYKGNQWIKSLWKKKSEQKFLN
ncbi:MAG TPA: phosphatase PAP2 family protein [Flavipsychrobacter sp.]|nr:phosphatase PAP2 family protein [Flavipsychrobacter sp.]